ncbi:MAG: von Willebrand factor type A domain-containing protein, partial [Bacteroidota bacterium]|nr:von Willebrand factor type A domain-containing protein [Bacteroidota bacterium]
MKSLFFFSGICLLILSFIPTQKRTISGKIEDEQKHPIAGASIIIKGTNTGTTSDVNGDFTMTILTDKATLVISAVGYQTLSLKLTNNDTSTIILKKSSAALDEVVVTGYGKAESYDKVFAPAPLPASRALTGKVSGVYLSQQSRRKQTGNKDKQIYQLQPNSDYNREGYDKIEEAPFLKTGDNPLSTFSIDVDAASYSNIRRFLNEGEMPPAGAVRVEEMINYFTYQYPQPTGDGPFSINTEIAACPWNKAHKLAMIGLQGKIIPAENLPASNLVFLIDVSGSMMEEDKLPLVQSSLKLLTDQLRPQDRVSLVAYAGNAGLVLSSTGGDKKATIKDAINRLEAGGSTAGGEGITLAYNVAKQNFIKGGNNRIILCTDGDFNVGVSSDDALERLIEKERESGVFLTVLGYGTGNYQDAKMQKLADKGNGNHSYIDDMSEAKKVLVTEFGGTLFT